MRTRKGVSSTAITKPSLSPIRIECGRSGKSRSTPRSAVVVGSSEEVAEELIAWVEDTDVDGFNLAYAVMPETFVDFVDLVVPELQRRGHYKRDYAPGTLREKFYGRGRARLGVDHPAVRFRSIADLPGS
jgi:hypothetical protein